MRWKRKTRRAHDLVPHWHRLRPGSRVFLANGAYMVAQIRYTLDDPTVTMTLLRLTSGEAFVASHPDFEGRQ